MYLDVLLETLYKDFDVLFVQEPPWRTIRQAPSSSNKEGEDVTGAPMHPEWRAFWFNFALFTSYSLYLSVL